MSSHGYPTDGEMVFPIVQKDGGPIHCANCNAVVGHLIGLGPAGDITDPCQHVKDVMSGLADHLSIAGGAAPQPKVVAPRPEPRRFQYPMGGTDPVPPLREKLAEIEHARWSAWQRWMHDRLERSCDGDLKTGWVLSEDDYDRWERQIATPYADLTDAEKASDMEQVDRYWPLIQELFDEIHTVRTARTRLCGQLAAAEAAVLRARGLILELVQRHPEDEDGYGGGAYLVEWDGDLGRCAICQRARHQGHTPECWWTRVMTDVSWEPPSEGSPDG